MLVAIPIGLLSAIYLSEFADKSFRTVVKPLLEILAGIPTVVYGFFAALTLAPAIRGAGEAVGIASLLRLGHFLKRHPPARSVMLVATAA